MLLVLLYYYKINILTINTRTVINNGLRLNLHTELLTGM